jgi:hypothetical protein
MEKWGGGGGGERACNQMREFQLALEECDLTDLGYRGLKHMWSNCRVGLQYRKERLDQGVANWEWRVLFPNVEVYVEAITNSDHAMLVINLLGQQLVCTGKSSFWYEALWALDQDYQTLLHNA